MRLRILATLRRQRVASMRTSLVPGEGWHSSEIQRQKEAARLGRVSGLLGQLKTGATAPRRRATWSRFQTRWRGAGKTIGGRHDLADLAMCAALSIVNRISFDRDEVEKRLAPVAQSLRWLSEVIA